MAEEAAKKEAEVNRMKESIEKDLAAAEPALAAAAEALDGLNKKDLGELKSLGKPPPGVDDVTAACIFMLHDGSKGKVDTSWKAAQIMMKDVNGFMMTLIGFKARIDAGKVPKANFKSMKPLLEKEHFNVETMRNKSNAAAGLCDYVRNITVYWDINEDTEPKREKGAQAARDLEAAINAKQEALRKKEAAEAMVADLTSQYNAAVKEQEDTKAEADMCERKLGLAKRLMAALGSEGARWEQSIVDLRAQLEILPGDLLLAAAFVSYSGCFSKRFREQLLASTYLPYLTGEIPAAKGGVPLSEGADPLNILCTEAERALWSSQNLPADRVSVENGAIVCNCARWPLMIDPQLQGVTWIKKREEKNGLKVPRLRQKGLTLPLPPTLTPAPTPTPIATPTPTPTLTLTPNPDPDPDPNPDQVARLGQKGLLPSLEAALVAGMPFVIENLHESYDAVLAPVVGRQVLRRGRQSIVKLGDKEVDYSPTFKLYLQTKLSNPHYPPEIQAETTLINFAVTEDGLEDQLLALTVAKERPDLEEQKAELILQQNENKIKIQELETGILSQLANAEGDVLENLELIENLEDSKRVSGEIASKMVEAAATEEQINHSREMYRPVAARGSLMFFLLSELNKVHSFNQYSLNSFITVFETAVTGKRARPRWMGGTGNCLLDMILPKPKKKGLWGRKVELKKVIATGKTKEQLEARLAQLLENITFQARTHAMHMHMLICMCVYILESITRHALAHISYIYVSHTHAHAGALAYSKRLTLQVYQFARRGLLDRHKLILATQLVLQVLRKAGSLVEAEVDFLTHGYIAGNSSLPPIPPQAALFLLS